VTPSDVAEIVTFVDAAGATVVIAKVPLAAPAAIVTLAGTVATSRGRCAGERRRASRRVAAGHAVVPG
jgi:hypothetical protein